MQSLQQKLMKLASSSNLAAVGNLAKAPFPLKTKRLSVIALSSTIMTYIANLPNVAVPPTRKRI
jgi:hypothetical protein